MEINFIETDMTGVLVYVRDKIHKGHKLLTHPLSGSIKPNESPYKSVLISGNTKCGGTQPDGTQSGNTKPNTTQSGGTQQSSIQQNTDLQSINIIEECILTAQKFPPKEIPEKYLHDLRTVDLSLIRNAL
jgi:hypothetical protein